MNDLLPFMISAAFLLSFIAAISSLLVLLGFTRLRGRTPVLGPEGFSDHIRVEADRIKADSAEQARGIRLELGEAIRGFQNSLLQQLDIAIERLRVPIVDIGQKLDSDIAKMGTEAASNRDALRAAIEHKLDIFGDRQFQIARDLRTELIDSFARTSAVLSETTQSLGVQQQQRLDKVALELGDMAGRQSVAQEALRLSVEGRLDAIRAENSTKLDEMRQTVDEKLQTALEKRLGESFRTVSEQLDRVHKGLGEMQTLATGVGDLKRVLSNVKTRGTLAEVQLGMLLEQFLSPDQFIRNAQIKEHSGERVEFAIKFAPRDAEGPLLLPIDAKFPQEDYERLVQAAERADSEAVEQAALALESRIKACAKTICDKYVHPPSTTDFGILYLPTESLFAEVLRRTGLHEQLLRDYRVMVAGPTTLSSLLSAFQMGFRSLAIQERSSEVWKILGAVRTEFAEHGKVVSKLQKQLGSASKTIEELGTRTRAMNRKLKDVETLPNTHAQSVLGLTSAVLAAAEDEDFIEAFETVPPVRLVAAGN